MFCRLGTRWVQIAIAGGLRESRLMVIGVRWEAVYPLLDRLDLPPDEWADLLAALEVMEQAALPVMRAAAAGKHK